MAARSSSTRPRAPSWRSASPRRSSPNGDPKGIEKAKAGLIKSPFLAGDGKEARNKQSGELHPGMGPDVFFIRPSANKDRPPAVWWKDPNKQEDETTVYSGCYGKAILNCFAWHNDKSGDGVSFGISGFQKHADGDRLGGSARRVDLLFRMLALLHSKLPFWAASQLSLEEIFEGRSNRPRTH